MGRAPMMSHKYPRRLTSHSCSMPQRLPGTEKGAGDRGTGDVRHSQVHPYFASNEYAINLQLREIQMRLKLRRIQRIEQDRSRAQAIVSQGREPTGGRGKRYQFRREHENAIIRRIVRLRWYADACSREASRLKRLSSIHRRIEGDGGKGTGEGVRSREGQF
jgi:hypothetical protein